MSHKNYETDDSWNHYSKNGWLWGATIHQPSRCVPQKVNSTGFARYVIYIDLQYVVGMGKKHSQPACISGAWSSRHVDMEKNTWKEATVSAWKRFKNSTASTWHLTLNNKNHKKTWKNIINKNKWFEPIWTHLNSADPPIFCMVKKAKDTISLWPAMGNSPRWGISPKSWSPCAAPHKDASGPVCLDVWMACTGHATWEFYTSRLFVRFKLCKTGFNYES